MSCDGDEEERPVGGVTPTLPPPVKVKSESPDEVDLKMGPFYADSDEVIVKVEAHGEVEVKRERIHADHGEVKVEAAGEVEVKREPTDADSDKVKLESPAVVEAKIKREPIDADIKHGWVKKEEQPDEIKVPVKEEQGKTASPRHVKKEEEEEDSSEDEVEIIDPPPKSKKRNRGDDDDVVFIDLTTSRPAPYLNPRPIRAMPPPGATPLSDWKMVVAPQPAEMDEYPPDHREWVFFTKSYSTGLSTCRRRKWLDAGEVVHFAFPSHESRIRVPYRQAVALSEIVRFSTNRSGEIGKLSPEWARCLAPLVSSSKVMIQGKMVFPMMELRLMQEVLLYVSWLLCSSKKQASDLAWCYASVQPMADPNYQLGHGPSDPVLYLESLHWGAKSTRQPCNTRMATMPVACVMHDNAVFGLQQINNWSPFNNSMGEGPHNPYFMGSLTKDGRRSWAKGQGKEDTLGDCSSVCCVSEEPDWVDHAGGETKEW
ncbi:DNA repair protein RAD5B [Triticum aestivum]|uniref:DNA repair protein RAD5B n=1 Tax=Triticum aestivum TaxID=4565 RepID=UPI001D01C52D|nr:DNA repair protein RAD5B-like [Triticum aestivum]